MTSVTNILLALSDRNSSDTRALSVYYTDSGYYYAVRSEDGKKHIGGTARDLQMAFTCLVREYNTLITADDGHNWDLSTLETQEVDGEVSALLDASAWFSDAVELDSGRVWNPESKVWYKHRVIETPLFFASQISRCEGSYPEGVRVASSIQFSTARYTAMNACNEWLDDQRRAGWRPSLSFGLAAELLPFSATAHATGDELSLVLL